MTVHQFRRPQQPKRGGPRNLDLLAWLAFLAGVLAALVWRLFVAGSGGGILVGLLVAAAVWLMMNGGGSGSRMVRRR
ncbi:MAG TPA: hypothetical protein VK943_12355 [Arenibaculum sp.]|nr:hypothetical protein [Arenibaculum sp.]